MPPFGLWCYPNDSSKITELKIMKNTIFIALIAAVVTGCTGVGSVKTGHIDASQKTVYIQPGGLRVLQPIKDTFAAEGWKIDELNQENSRYLVHTNIRTIELFCINQWSEIEIELLLMDRKTKSSVFSITSRTCDSYSNFTDELRKMLRN
jgi:hypothetical protein